MTSPAAAPARASGAAAIDHAYARLAACRVDSDRIAATAVLVLEIFDDFYARVNAYPFLAKAAFEQRDPGASIRISRERLVLYSRYVAEHGPRLRSAYPALSEDLRLWDALDAAFVPMIADRYEADIAFSFAHSLRRNICHDLWRPVAYSFPPPSKRRVNSMAAVHRRLPVATRVDAALIAAALRVPGFEAPFRDFDGDVRALCRRLESIFAGLPQGAVPPLALDVVQAGFFRDRTAFLVGRWQLRDGRVLPFVVALLNGPEGIVVDALVHETADVHNLFSSALANFHVTTHLYYQTCVFLHSLMPLRPLGHQYSTIGYNHVGKVAILNEIIEQMRQSGQRFGRSPGEPGTVALGFTFDACSYHLKVIRDRPTRAYKWGTYPGVPAVVEKYRVVHEINRAGSMLDAVLYFNVRLARELFEPELLADICDQASESVQQEGDGVLMRSLIVQMKIIPLPVYLETADEAQTRAAIESLGTCIRNNAAANIFNKDLDSRNYGVGRYGRVFLFDYDAVERLTEVKIRTNTDREPGEDAVPSWFFEDGVVFLPEELELGMRFRTEYARRCFRRLNADLLGTAYWEGVQQRLQRGEVPELDMYPAACRLEH